jgi:hypothetical protein
MVVCELRQVDGKRFEIWAPTALKERMVGDTADDLPLWIAVPVTKERKFINIAACEFTDIDFEKNPWARTVRNMNIPPVYLDCDGELGDDGHETRGDRAKTAAGKRKRGQKAAQCNNNNNNSETEDESAELATPLTSKSKARSKRLFCQYFVLN